MTDIHPSDPDAPELTRADRRFVAKLADAYRTEPPSPERRVAFRAGLDARIRRRGAALPLRALAGAVAAGAAAWLVVSGLGSGEADREPRIARAGDPRPAAGSSHTATVEEAILALSAEDDEDESLPDDYAAIAGLFLDG